METPPPILQTPDFAVREMESARPRLRADIRFRPDSGATPAFLAEDPLYGRFFRLGEREYRFARALDGSRSLGEIVASFANPTSGHGRSGSFQASEAVSLFRSLADAGLIEAEDAGHTARVDREQAKRADSARLLGKAGNLLCMRIPMGNPDAFFAWLARHAGWLTGRWFFLLWLLLAGAGSWTVVSQWARFSAEANGIFQVGNLWPLLPVALVLKAWHEMWHGLFCRRHGGEVPEIGVAFLLLVTPLGYVNATSSLRFPSRWPRIQVAAAGIYGEAFLAALAALAWGQLSSGSMVSAILHQVILISGVTTLLFNANPLMRFDGYYVFSDLVGQPNLATRGQQMVNWLLQRWVFGFRDVPSPLWPGESKWLVVAYGLAAAVWRIIVTAGLLVTAAHLFHGAGLILAILAGGAQLVTQGGGLLRLISSSRGHGSSPWRVTSRLAILGTGMIASLFLAGWDSQISAPAVVRSTSGGEVRAGCPGFLAEAVVRPGQSVQAGAALIVLLNIEETAKLRQAELDTERSRMRRDAFLAAANTGAYHAECEHLAALEQRHLELRNYVETLTLRAPRDGVVIADNLADLQGTWVPSGQLLLEVASPQEREVLILASPRDADAFRDALAAQHTARFESAARTGSHPIGIDRVAAGATLHPGHFALMAPFQGPLAVRRMGEGAEHGIGDHELVSPRIEVRACLRVNSIAFVDGERGRVTLNTGKRRVLAERIGDFLADWLDQAQGSS